MLQRGGMLGGILALDAVSPAMAGATPAASSVRFKAIDAAYVHVKFPIDVDGFALVAPDDFRIKAIKSMLTKPRGFAA